VRHLDAVRGEAEDEQEPVPISTECAGVALERVEARGELGSTSVRDDLLPVVARRPGVIVIDDSSIDFARALFPPRALRRLSLPGRGADRAPSTGAFPRSDHRNLRAGVPRTLVA
jgi:hypothetical protein